jgi:hypothetical protein
LAVCALAAASGGCQLQLSDGRAGKGGDGPDDVTKTEDGGASTNSGGASTANGGAPSTSHAGSANGTAQAGSTSAGAGPSAGASSSAIAYEEDCANTDAVPNDDREHAVDFGAGATVCVLDSSDSDWFYLDTPNDGRAHVIEFDISETDASWIDIDIMAGKDGSDLGRIHPSQRGLKMSAFLTVGPDTRTFFDVNGYLANTDTTTIKVSVTAEADDHEPNNDQASATLIQPETEVSAQLIVPYVSATDQQVEDWYKAELTAGKHTVQVTAVPSDLYPNFEVRDSTNTVLTSSEHGPNRGATFSFTFTAAEAGTYYLMVDEYVGGYILYSGTKADSDAKPYKFQID